MSRSSTHPTGRASAGSVVFPSFVEWRRSTMRRLTALCYACPTWHGPIEPAQEEQSLTASAAAAAHQRTAMCLDVGVTSRIVSFALIASSVGCHPQAPTQLPWQSLAATDEMIA